MDVRNIDTKGYKEFADTLRRASEENHPAAMWLQSLCGEAADYLETLLYIHENAYLAYRALGPVEELAALVKAHIDQPPAKEGDPKPSCFYEYGDSLWCLGLSHECDDEPLDRCKQCWYCESGDYADDRAEEETALGGGGCG